MASLPAQVSFPIIQRCMLYMLIQDNGHRKNIFQGRPLGDFSKIFVEEPKVVKLIFSHSKLENNLVFAEILKFLVVQEPNISGKT